MAVASNNGQNSEKDTTQATTSDGNIIQATFTVNNVGITLE